MVYCIPQVSLKCWVVSPKLWTSTSYFSNSTGSSATSGRAPHSLFLGPLHTRDWMHVTIAFQALSPAQKAEPVQVRFTLCLRDQRSPGMRDGYQVYMDSYMASNGSCCMVTWTIFKNHMLEVGLTQNWEIMALRTLTTIDSLYFIMREDPAWREIHWNSIWWRARSHLTSH